MCLMETLKYIDTNECEPYVLIPNHGTTEKILKELNIPYKVVRCYDWLVSRQNANSFSYKCKRPIRFLINLLAEIRIAKIMKKEKIDLYHINSVYNCCGFFAAQNLGLPVIWHIREFVEDKRWLPVFYDSKVAYKIMSQADQLIAVSNCIKENFQEKMPTANITVVYDGVDFQNATSEAHKEVYRNPVHLTIVGGVSRVKGHEDAIKAVAILKRRGMNCKLSIVGRIRDKKYESELIDLINENAVSEIVNFEGNSDDMECVWSKTDIVLVCSRSESFGRVAIEAMYHGLPIVGADNSGTHELLQGSICSLLYQTGDSNALADQIIDIITQPKWADLRETSIHRAKKFSSKVSAENLLAVLKEVHTRVNRQ